MNPPTRSILYTFRRCPYAMRARMAIHYADVDLEQIEVSLKNKPPSLIQYSPKATVPVVVTSDGKVIDESRDIMLWALQHTDPDNWLLKNDIVKQQQMFLLVDECDLEFKPLADRYKYFDRYPDKSQIEYREQAEKFLRQLENKLHAHRFLTDDNLRFADVAIFPFVRQFAAVDKVWFTQSQYTNLQRWLDLCVNTELFNAIMKLNKVDTIPSNF